MPIIIMDLAPLLSCEIDPFPSQGRGVRVWIVCSFPTPRPSFRARYWVHDDDVDDQVVKCGWLVLDF